MKSSASDDHVLHNDNYGSFPDYEPLYYYGKNNASELRVPNVDTYADAPDLNFTVKITDSQNGSTSDIELEPLPSLKRKRTFIRAKMGCDMAYGVFEPLDKTCYNFVYLSSICVKVSLDKQSGEWALNRTWGGYGCVGDPYSPTVLNVTAGYSVLRITEPEEIDYYLPLALGNV